MEPDNQDRAEELFLAAADLPPAEQARFLDAACGGLAELRSEVDAMLASDRKQGATIAAAVGSEAAAFLDSPTLIGSRVGAYRVIREVGRGGMGAVYLATRDDDEFDKRVAIKVVKRGLDTDEILGRFRHERQILASLDHPYIARLIDGGNTGDGRPFLVMEFVDGQSINHYSSGHSLSIAARCRLFLKVCEAVSYAHRNLVIHRDLKPGNILITADGAPKLLDFGVAKILNSEIDGGLTINAQSRPLTPDYASPEQLSGLPAGTATDIYSLGVILHELLTGQKLRRNLRTEHGDAPRSILESDPPKPSAALTGVPNSERLRRQLQGDLDNIVLKAMQKEPWRRYTSVDHFADDIHAHLESRPVSARKDSLWYRTAKFARRRRYALLAASAVAASIFAGVVIALSQAHEARVARDAAEERLAQIVSVSNRSLSDVYARLERLPGAMPARKELVGSTVELLKDLSRQSGSDPRVRIALAKAYLKLGNLQGDPDGANIGDVAGALASYREGAQLLDPGARDPVQMALWVDLQNQTGKVLAEIGDRRGARQTMEGAMGMMDRPGAPAIRNKAGLYLSLSRVLDEPDLPLALDLARKAVQAATAEAQQSPNDTDAQLTLSTANTQVGYVYIRMGNPQAAEFPYRESMRIRERLAREHPNDVVCRRHLRLAYEHYAALQGSPERPNLGHPDIARAYYKKAQPLEEADRDDPENHSARFDYAFFLLNAAIVDVPQEQLEESLASLRRTAATFEALSAESPGVERYDRALALAREYWAYRLFALKRYSEALVVFRATLEVATRILARHPGDPVIQRQVQSAKTGISQAQALLR